MLVERGARQPRNRDASLNVAPVGFNVSLAGSHWDAVLLPAFQNLRDAVCIDAHQTASASLHDTRGDSRDERDQKSGIVARDSPRKDGVAS